MNTQIQKDDRQYGELRKHQESYIDAINQDILQNEDFKHLHIPSLKQRLNTFKRKYMHFDADHSGYIGFQEMKQLLEQLGQPRTHLEAKRLLQNGDQNGDGAVSYRGFVNVLIGSVSADELMMIDELDLDEGDKEEAPTVADTPRVKTQPLKTGKVKRQAPKPPGQQSPKPKIVSFSETVEDISPKSDSAPCITEHVYPVVEEVSPWVDDQEPIARSSFKREEPKARAKLPVITAEIMPRDPPPRQLTAPVAEERSPPPDYGTAISNTDERRDGNENTSQVHILENGTAASHHLQAQQHAPSASQPHVHQNGAPPYQQPQTQQNRTPQQPGSQQDRVQLTPGHATNPALPRLQRPVAPSGPANGVHHAASVPQRMPSMGGVSASPAMNFAQGYQLHPGTAQGMQSYIQPCTVPGCTDCPKVYSDTLPDGNRQIYQPLPATVLPYGATYAPHTGCNCATCMGSLSGLTSPTVVPGQPSYTTQPYCACCNGQQAQYGHSGLTNGGQVHSMNHHLASLSLSNSMQ